MTAHPTTAPTPAPPVVPPTDAPTPTDGEQASRRVTERGEPSGKRLAECAILLLNEAA